MSLPTLATLRDRVLQQVTNPEGGIDFTVVTASALTLATMRDRVELVLQDSGNVKWAEGDIDEAITQAMEQYSRYKPNHAIGTVTLGADGREVSISTLTGLIRVEKVWWDYDSSSPGHPPNWRHFKTWPGSIIYIDDPYEPQDNDVIRIWYTKEQTINGLESASATTFAKDDDAFLIAGAAAFAARFRAIELSETLNIDRDVVKRITEWAEIMMEEFNEGLKIRDWRRWTFGYDQNDIDEAIRWALGRYNEINPEITITTLTLGSDGREVDISTITDYTDISQVWWPYDSTSPSYPPRWRNFELWPGDILFIDSQSEPQSSDVVRIWYERLRTINGLDTATTTTLLLDAETLIVIGASGFVTQERVQDERHRYVPRKLREWADARLGEFEDALRRLAGRQAARHSGIAASAPLDRWDRDREDGTW